MRVLGGFKLGLVTLSAISLLAGLEGAQAAPAGPDLALYGRLPAIEDLALSPNGDLVALIVTDGEARRINVYDVKAKKTLVSVEAGDTKLRSVDFADDDTLVIIGSRTTSSNLTVLAEEGEYSGGLLYSIKDRSTKPLLGRRDSNYGSLVNMIRGRPEVRHGKDGVTRIYAEGVTFDGDGQGVVSEFEVTLPSGRTRVLRQGVTDTTGFLVDGDGQLAAESFHSDRTGAHRLRVRSNGRMVDVALPEKASGASLEGFGPDGSQVLISYRVEDEDVWAYASGDGKVTATEDLSANAGLLLDRATGRQFAETSRRGDELTYHFFDPADQKAWTGMTRAFKGQMVSFADVSADRKRWLLRVDSPEDGPAVYLVDLATGQADDLGGVYRGLKASDISPVRSIRYEAADGTKITGYLTLPRSAGASPKALPLVVLPHGGPASRDERGFDWWAQALAAQGYAVLQPNFRGSSGFGYEFLEAGFGQWGRKMQTDLSDGVRDLAKQGLIDPKRVCIVGASYGGYAALAGATLDTGVYRCAVSVAGPADLKRMLIDDGRSKSALRYWSKFMGVDGIADPDLAAISPASHADAVTIPLLLIHGKDDTVVSYNQSQIMADAMRKAGKPVEFVTLNGEDHWLSRGATRLQMLQAVSAFLAKNNPP